jgi:hypothetical protein
MQEFDLYINLKRLTPATGNTRDTSEKRISTGTSEEIEANSHAIQELGAKFLRYSNQSA